MTTGWPQSGIHELASVSTNRVPPLNRRIAEICNHVGCIRGQESPASRSGGCSSGTVPLPRGRWHVGCSTRRILIEAATTRRRPARRPPMPRGRPLRRDSAAARRFALTQPSRRRELWHVKRPPSVRRPGSRVGYDPGEQVHGDVEQLAAGTSRCRRPGRPLCRKTEGEILHPVRAQASFTNGR